MKHFIRTAVYFFALASCQQVHAGKSLAVYLGSAHVHLILFDTDNPKHIIKSLSRNSASGYKYLGKPTNIAYFDSPPQVLAYAINELLEDLSVDWMKIDQLWLDHFSVFVAGYDFFAHELICAKADGFGYVDEDIRRMTGNAGAAGSCLTSNGVPVWLEDKEAFFWRTLDRFNHELGQTIKARHRSLKGDHLLLTQAARINLIREEDTYEFIPNTDMVQLSTCAPGYQIRNGTWVEESSVSPDNPKDGGFHQVGRDGCSRYLKPATGPFTVGKVYNNIVLNALSALPVAEEYASYRNDSILNRWKDGFSNELGIAITMVLRKAALPEKDEDLNPQIQEELIPLIIGEPPMEHGTLQSVVQTIRKLEQKGHALLPNGRKNRIRLLGEFPWDELGLKTFFRFELTPETYSRFEFIIAQDYEPMLAIAAAYIYQHPELFDKDDDDDE